MDLTKTNILLIDLQWLGVGRVRIGVVINGTVIYVHQFLNANILTLVYMETGSLPCRYEVKNTGTSNGTVTIDTICATVQIEGSTDNFRKCFTNSISNNTTTKSLSNGGALVPVLAIRSKTTFNGLTNRTSCYVQDYTLIVTGSNPIYFEVHINTALTGASYVDVNTTNSAMEYDVSATAFTSGIVIDSGYIGASASFKGSVQGDIQHDVPLVYTILNNVQDILLICARSMGGASSCAAAMTLQEVW